MKSQTWYCLASECISSTIHHDPLVWYMGKEGIFHLVMVGHEMEIGCYKVGTNCLYGFINIITRETVARMIQACMKMYSNLHRAFRCLLMVKHENNVLHGMMRWSKIIFPRPDRDFGSQYQGPGCLPGCMHDPWENTCTCTVNIRCILGNNLS